MSATLFPLLQTFLSYAFVLVTSMWFGSYATMAVYRLPRGLTWIGKDTRCLSCDTPLTLKDFIPIFSYFLHHGKCRHCGVAYETPGLYLFVELAIALLGLAAFMLHGFSQDYVLLSMISVTLIVMMAIDISDQRHMPNKCLLTLLCLALLYRIPLDDSIFTAIDGGLFGLVSAMILRHLYYVMIKKDAKAACDYLAYVQKDKFEAAEFSWIKFWVIACLMVGMEGVGVLSLLTVCLSLVLYLCFWLDSHNRHSVPWFVALASALLITLYVPAAKALVSLAFGAII